MHISLAFESLQDTKLPYGPGPEQTFIIFVMTILLLGDLCHSRLGCVAPIACKTCFAGCVFVASPCGGGAAAALLCNRILSEGSSTLIVIQ